MTSLASIAAAVASRPSRTDCSRSATDSPSLPGRTGASSAGPSAPDVPPLRPRVRDLLSRAAALFDAPHSPLREAAPRAGRRGFTSGAAWMRLALETVRGVPCPLRGPGYGHLGLIKYGLAAAAALLWAGVAWALGLSLLAPFAVLVFYAIEAQMVFLFPLALDGSARPFRTARAWTGRAGGTIAVLRIVLPLAGVMLLGGVVGRGFVRCWCLGCLAVCLWYEGSGPVCRGGVTTAAHA